MAWTYDDQDLGLPLNALRLRIGDTIESRPLFSDEELEAFLSGAGDNILRAAVVAMRVLEARAAREVDKWVGDLKILASQRHRQYQRTLEELEVQALGALGVPSAGGIRVSQKEANTDDTDLVEPAFRRDMHDYIEEP